MSASWFDRLLSSIADRGRAWVKIPTGVPPLEQALQLSRSLISERGEASGAALSRALLESLSGLGEADRLTYYLFLANDFAPDPAKLRLAAEAYLASPTPATAQVLGEVAEPPRQELLRPSACARRCCRCSRNIRTWRRSMPTCITCSAPGSTAASSS
jgi:malonyl-CoA decarboxylase